MSSRFDRLQKRVFDKAKDTFGYDASYTSADQTVTWEGLVLFADPTRAYELAGMEVSANRYVMEYREGDLPGLKERVDERGSLECVTVDGNKFSITSVDQHHDGETYRAYLVPFQE